MASIRPAAVAGMFYPGEPRALAAAVRVCSGASSRARHGSACRRRWSSRTRATSTRARSRRAPARARRRTRPRAARRPPGAGHRVPVRGLAAPSATPSRRRSARSDRPCRAARWQACPRLWKATGARAGAFARSAVAVPADRARRVRAGAARRRDGEATEVAEVLERLWGGPETLVVISTDLSHYQLRGRAQRGRGDPARASRPAPPTSITPKPAARRR